MVDVDGAKYGDFDSAAIDWGLSTADTGYEFVSWTEDGSVVSTDAAYTFTVSSDRTLVANFKRLQYLITFVNDDGTEPATPPRCPATATATSVQ